MMNFLQYILHQPTNSLMYRMFEVQQENPTKGDWASSVKELIQVYQIKLTICEIKGMVHMITMSTYIAQIDIGEYKNHFKCPETTLVTLFWLLFVP